MKKLYLRNINVAWSLLFGKEQLKQFKFCLFLVDFSELVKANVNFEIPRGKYKITTFSKYP